MHRIIEQSPQHSLHRDTESSPLDFVASYEHLIPWSLIACRHSPRTTIAEFLPLLLTHICTHIRDDTSRSKLFSEAAVLLLIDVEGGGHIAHPEALHSLLSHPQITAAFLVDPVSKTPGGGAEGQGTSCLRERLTLSLCRAIVKLLPNTLAYVIESSSGSASNVVQSLQANGSSKRPNEAPSERKQKPPFGGIGCYAELFNSTVRSSDMQHVSEGSDAIDNSSQSYSRNDGKAFEQLDNLIACAMFVLRSSHK